MGIVAMINYQIKNRGIYDAKVIKAMEDVDRKEFVLGEYIDAAYCDGPLPIGFGQTISQPYIVALMTQELSIQATSKVLEIGTGSGYQTAILSNMANKIYSVEVVKELYDKAKENFNKLNYKNISLKFGNGYYGWDENAPYDLIIVTCAPKEIPQSLINQLKVGGKMCIPVGSEIFGQNLILVEKISEDSIITKNICESRFVSLINKIT